MSDGLDDFQRFRADLNEEILACRHIGANASSPSTTRPTKQTHWYQDERAIGTSGIRGATL